MSNEVHGTEQTCSSHMKMTNYQKGSTDMSTTTAPVEAGATFPMPPRPYWADEPVDLTEGSIGYSHTISDDEDPFDVALSRRDWIRPAEIIVGETEIVVAADDGLTVEQAHRLVTLLELAADFAESTQ